MTLICRFIMLPLNIPTDTLYNLTELWQIRKIGKER